MIVPTAGSHDFRWLDAVRAVAAVIVVVSHVRDILWQDYAGGGALAFLLYFITGLGHAGVVVFFVLSGFWITKSVTSRVGSSGFWRDYMVDRLSRLWIVLLPCLAIGGGLDWWGGVHLALPLYNGLTGAHSLEHPLRESLTVSSLLASMVFLQTIVAPPFGSNGPLWSLANEFWFYVWLPALLLSLRLRRPSPALVALALGIVQPQLLIGFVTWLFGTGAYLLLFTPGAERRLRRHGRVLLAVGLALTAGALIVIRVLPRPWMDPVLGAAFALLLVGWGLMRPRFPNRLRFLPTFGANSSFSLYACHYPVTALLGGMLTIGGRLPFSARGCALLLAVTAVTILGGILLSHATEAYTNSVRRAVRAWRFHPLPRE